jgi:hypothetical protein
MLTSWFGRSIIIGAMLCLGLAVGLAVPLALGSGGSQILQGDLDCNGAVAPRDGQAALTYFLNKPPLSQTEPCPDIGTLVELGSTPTPVPSVGLSRGNPAPAGVPYRVPEGWEITILDFKPDATQEVLDENQFNDPPDPGYRFSMIRIRVKNVSADDPDDPDPDYALRLLGSENVGYTTFDNSCGVIPDDFTFMSNDVFRGGEQTGNICFQTKIGESGFVLYTHYFLSDDENTRWLAVQ